MKQIYLVFLCISISFFNDCYSQAPQAIPYQAVARDNAGGLISNQNISLRFSIHDATAGGTVVYKETKSTTTNAFGLFSVNVGQGTVVTGTFSSINWGGGSKFLQVEMDATGGVSYVDMGTQQMLSVPYALSSSDNRWSTSGANIFNNNLGNVGIGTATPTAISNYTSLSINNAVNGGILDLMSNGIFKMRLVNTSSTAVIETNTGIPFIISPQGTEAMRVVANGNVGIGTTTPTAKLHVNGDIRWGGLTSPPYLYSGYRGNGSFIEHIGTTGSDSPLRLQTSRNGDGINYSQLFIDPANGFNFTSNGTANNNVGIGTPTPALNFEVVGLNVAAATSGSAANGIVRIHPAGTNLVMDIGTFSSTGAHGWIQMRDNQDYSSNWPLALNPNGGNVGIGTSTPAASALLDVTSTTKGFLPPRMTTAQRDAITPVAGLMIYNTSTNIPNYYDGTEWLNFGFNYRIGDNVRGGQVAYIFTPNDPGYIVGETHGLIATASDQSLAQWGCQGTVIPGADGTALRTGNQNTIDIMAGCATAGIAARLCGDLVLNGYSDWYLPSKDELNKLYINQVAIGGFASGSYWSSSENDNTSARSQSFLNGSTNQVSKGAPLNVRAVRVF